MVSVLIGFGVIGTVILIGYIVGRVRLFTHAASATLGRVTFYVLSPCLLFSLMAEADLHALFSSLLLVSATSALLVIGLFALVAGLFWKRRIPELVIGALSSGYVNAANIGIAVALYVLGDAAASAPVILFQLLVLAPIAFTILDYNQQGRVSLRRVLTRPFRNPIIVATLLGVAVTLIGIELPMPVLEPFRVIGAAAVPMILLSFGMSLSGTRILAPGSGRRDVILASFLKLVVMPLAAWMLGDFVLGLEGQALFVVVVLASLPTAQNVFNYAQHYGRGVIIARDAALVTSVGAVPLLMIVAAFLAPR